MRPVGAVLQVRMWPCPAWRRPRSASQAWLELPALQLAASVPSTLCKRSGAWPERRGQSSLQAAQEGQGGPGPGVRVRGAKPSWHCGSEQPSPSLLSSTFSRHPGGWLGQRHRPPPWGQPLHPVLLARFCLGDLPGAMLGGGEGLCLQVGVTHSICLQVFEAWIF